jgi:DNA-binding PadR family transcriptional regulator
VDRAISNRDPDCIGPFFAEIDELVAAGWIEVRATPNLPDGLRYWLTDAGRAAVAKFRNAQ